MSEHATRIKEILEYNGWDGEPHQLIGATISLEAADQTIVDRDGELAAEDFTMITGDFIHPHEVGKSLDLHAFTCYCTVTGFVYFDTYDHVTLLTSLPGEILRSGSDFLDELAFPARAITLRDQTEGESSASLQQNFAAIQLNLHKTWEEEYGNHEVTVHRPVQVRFHKN